MVFKYIKLSVKKKIIILQNIYGILQENLKFHILLAERAYKRGGK